DAEAVGQGEPARYGTFPEPLRVKELEGVGQAALRYRGDLGRPGQEGAHGNATIARGVRPEGREGIAELSGDEGADDFGGETHGHRSDPTTTVLERADQALHPLVVTLERVLAKYGLALGVIELEIDPVPAVVLALEVGLPDELPAQARPC